MSQSSIAVVLDESCAQLDSDVRQFAESCVFRRDGGFFIEASEAAAQFCQLVETRNLQGRAIYVAPSYAAFTGLLVASRDRARLAGLMLVDPSHPRQGEQVLRALADLPPSTEAERLKQLFAGFGPAWDNSCQLVRGIRDLGALPLRILVAGRFDFSSELPEESSRRLMEERYNSLREYASLSRRSDMILVNEAGHDIARQKPGDVLAAICEFARDISTNR